MSQLEETPSAIIRNFGENLIDKMEDLAEDDIARQLVLAVLTIVEAAVETAEGLERAEVRNESA
jgi:hypothetical protein